MQTQLSIKEQRSSREQEKDGFVVTVDWPIYRYHQILYQKPVSNYAETSEHSEELLSQMLWWRRLCESHVYTRRKMEPMEQVD